MQVETLEELKARNLKEAEAENNAVAEKAKLQEEELQKLDESDDSAKQEETETSADDLQTADEAGDEEKKVVPLAAHVELRTKLKAKVKEKDSELETMRQKLEALEQQLTKPQQTVKQAVSDDSEDVPDPLDFNTTAEYKAALKKFVAKQVRDNISLEKQTTDAKARQDDAAKKQADAIDSHYKRAARLVEDSGISADLYRDADLKVKEAVEAVFPGSGDVIAESLISTLGEGSEKVIYFLGRNEEARSKLVTKLMTDKTGLAASVYLGQLLAEKGATVATKNSSGAPAPAARVKGGSKSVVSAVELKRQYDAAHKRGEYGDALNAKFAAKAAGIDTKSW